MSTGEGTGTRAALTVGLDRTIRVAELSVPASGTTGTAAHEAVLEALDDTQIHYYPLGTAVGGACLAVGAGRQGPDHPVNALAGDIIRHYESGGPSIVRGRALVLGGSPSAPTLLPEGVAVDLAHMIMIKVRTSATTVRSAPIVAIPPRRI